MFCGAMISTPVYVQCSFVLWTQYYDNPIYSTAALPCCCTLLSRSLVPAQSDDTWAIVFTTSIVCVYVCGVVCEVLPPALVNICFWSLPIWMCWHAENRCSFVYLALIVRSWLQNDRAREVVGNLGTETENWTEMVKWMVFHILLNALFAVWVMR